MTAGRITVVPRHNVYGWDSGNPPLTTADRRGGAQPPERFPVLGTADAFTRRYATDSHFLPYSIQGLDICPRINGGGRVELMKAGRDIVFGLLVIDLDAPEHGKNMTALQVRNWTAAQLTKVQASPLWSTAGWYSTRGGARLCWLLDSMGVDEYLRKLAAVRAALAAVDVEADRLIDWQRIYRLPRATREGVQLDLPMDLRRLGLLPEIEDAAEDDYETLLEGVDTARIGPFLLPDFVPLGNQDSVLAQYAGQLQHKGYPTDMIVDALNIAYISRFEPAPDGTPPHTMVDFRRIARSMNRFEPDRAAAARERLEAIGIKKGYLPDIIDAAAALLEQSATVYQRAGELVMVTREPEPRLGRTAGAAVIRVLSDAGLRTMLGRLAKWHTYKKAPKGSEEDFIEIPADVPPDVVAGVQALHAWNVRVLTGLVETPTLRSDGSVLDQPGYDELTGLVFTAPPGLIWPVIPEAPTRDEALTALAVLREIVCDFPFESEAHESVALAALLTTVARQSINGPTPLFIFDATTPRSGKTLLAHAVSTMATGHGCGTMVQTEQAEQEKRITSLLLAGETNVLIDNVDKPLGGAALDAAMTADIWQGRRLGKSEMVRVPNCAIWMATGNNVAVRGDLAPRCLRVYLVPGVERPEQRTGFRHEDLLGWIRQHRGRLVGAVLTLLRAYWAAGQPRQALAPFGGFGAWSRAIRSPLVWLGCVDPCVTTAEVRYYSDSSAEAHRTLVLSWYSAYSNAHKTVREILDAMAFEVFGGSSGSSDSDIDQMRQALIELCGDNRGEINARRVGWKLRQFNGRIVDGLRIERVEGTSRAGVVWRVERVGNVVSAVS